MPPTGKKCTRVVPAEDVDEQEEVQESPLVLQMQKQMEIMQRQMERMATDRQEAEASRMAEDISEASGNTASSDRPAEQEIITPQSLRSDVQAMERAARRIAQYRDSDDESTDGADGIRAHKTGKKSGSLLKAADVVKKRIDWPHLYIQRVVGGNRVGVDYKELRIEEFVYGFLVMLDAHRGDWDREVMLGILKMIMQDTMDFTWAGALGFYQLFGVDVEHGIRRWDNLEDVRDMRMMHSRTVLPKKEDAKETVKVGPKKGATQNLRCCALYQRKACEQSRDHQPFTHACSYCARNTGVAYRHPEDDCFRKAIDDTKNSKKRE